MVTARTPRIVIEDLVPVEQLTPEEMARLLGAGPRYRSRLGLEALETREVMASHLTASLSAGVLRIEGTDQGDNILVRQDGNSVSIQGITISVGNQQQATVNRNAITSVQVFGLGGADTIRFNDVVFQSGIVDGGDGADSITYRGSGVTLVKDATDRTVTGAMAEVYFKASQTYALGEAITSERAHRSGGTVQQFTFGDIWIKGTEVQVYHAYESVLNKGTLDNAGNFAVSSTKNNVNYDETAFLNYQPTYSVRPTLLVLTQGLNSESTSGPDRGYGLQAWQSRLASNMARELNAAGSMVHIMKVDWASQSPNTSNNDDIKLDKSSKASGAEQVADHILKFLSEHKTQWDVSLIGYSRGGIFSAEMARLLDRGDQSAKFEGEVPSSLGAKQRIRTLQLILLDPTASVSMGDQYPSSVPNGVEKTVLYDDGYTLYPGSATRESLPINGADYKRVTVPDVEPFGPKSHLALPNWYAEVREHRGLGRTAGAEDLTFQRDLEWLLGQKGTTTGNYTYETNGVGSEVVVATGPNGISNYIDIGFDQNKNGDAVGYLSVLGVGGGAFTIGKSGLNVAAGVTTVGAAGVSINNKGIGISYTGIGYGPLNINGGVILGVDETRLDVDAGPMRISLFGKGAGIYMGGQKVAGLDIDTKMSANSIRVDQLQTNGKKIETTIANGVITLRNTLVKGVQTLKEEWLEGGKKIETTFVNGVATLRNTFINAVQTFKEEWLAGAKKIETTFANGVSTLRNTFVNGVQTFKEEWGAAGKKLETTFVKGAATLRNTFVNGAQTFKEEWLAAGKKIETTFVNKVSTLRNTFVNGVQTFKEEWLAAGKKLETTFANGVSSLRNTFVNGVQTFKEEWLAAGKKIETTFANGVSTLRNTFVHGVQTFKEEWLAAGKKIETTFANGVSNLRNTFVNGAQTFKEEWLAAGKKIETTFAKGASTLRNTFVNGVQTFKEEWLAAGKKIETTFANGVSSLRNTFVNGAQTFKEEWLAAGKKIETTFAKGAATLRNTFVNGAQTFKEEWLAAGKKIETTFVNKVSTLRNTFVDGAQTFKEEWLSGGKKIETTFADGVSTLRNTFVSGVQTFKEQWLSGGKKIETTFVKGVSTLRNTFINSAHTFKEEWLSGGKKIETTFANGYSTLRNTFINSAQTFKEEWLSGGKKIETTFANGVSTLRNTFVDGAQTFKEQWLAGGKKIETTFENGVSTLRNTFVNGAHTFKEQWLSGGKKIETTFINGYSTLRNTFINNAQTFKEEWLSGGRKIETTFVNGYSTLRNTFVNGANVFREVWNSGGGYVTYAWDAAGNAISGGWNEVRKIFGF